MKIPALFFSTFILSSNEKKKRKEKSPCFLYKRRKAERFVVGKVTFHQTETDDVGNKFGGRLCPDPDLALGTEASEFGHERIGGPSSVCTDWIGIPHIGQRSTAGSLDLSLSLAAPPVFPRASSHPHPHHFHWVRTLYFALLPEILF